MWKRFLLTFGLVFLSFAGSILPLNNLNAYAHESRDFSGLSETDRQRIFRNFQYFENLKYINDFKVQYLVYNTREYSTRDNYKLIAYVCEKSESREIKSMPYCGSYLSYQQNSGKYEIAVKAFFVAKYDYNAKTKSLGSSYEQNDLSWVKDENFKRIYHSTDDPDYFIIYSDTKNKVNQFDIRPSDSVDPKNTDNPISAITGALDFIRDIPNGIYNFFRPLLDSTEKMVNSTADGFKSVADGFLKIPEMLGEFVKSLFVFDTADVQRKAEEIKLQTFNKLGSLGMFFDKFSSIFASLSVNGSQNCQQYSFLVAKSHPFNNFTFDFCHVPNQLLLIARVLLILAILFILLRRLNSFLQVLFGSRYFWQVFDNNDKEDE